MRPEARDLLGITVVAGAIGLVFVHEGDRHRDVHVRYEEEAAALVDIGHRSADSQTATIIVFNEFRVPGASAALGDSNRSVVVRGGEISWIGPPSQLRIPEGAQVLQGDGTQYLVAADDAARAHGSVLSEGESADMMVLSDDPLISPETLEHPLCVMRQGVVVSLSPSFAAAG